MRKIFLPLMIGVSVLFNLQTGYGYDNKEAHPGLNQAVVDEFVRRLPNYMMRYNEFKRFEKYVFSDFDKTPLKGVDVLVPGYKSITEGPNQMTAKKWIMRGGYTADEPELIAAVRHFYDPEANNQGKHYLTDLGTEVVNPAIDAIYWAFTGIDKKDRTNEWTWDKGKEYLKMGLETPDEEKAGEYFGKAFRCLGEVLHNTADMGCPPHVRNDAHGGYPGIGGSDPYESQFNPEWIKKYQGSVPDPEYARQFRTTNSGKGINIALAEFTNRNFFSNETISGIGLEKYTSKNKMPDYGKPKLQQLVYNDLNFGYWRKFDSGRDVCLCTDKPSTLGDIMTLRTDPWIDTASVHSQAKELVPNIVEAGINLVRIFIPSFSVELSQNQEKIKVHVNHLPDKEYKLPIAYAGKVIFQVKKTDGKISIHKENIINGKFEGDLSYLKNGDKLQASVEFADIAINSGELVIKKEEPVSEWLNRISHAAVNISWGCPVGSATNVERFFLGGMTLPDCNYKSSGSSFSCECSNGPETSVSFGEKRVNTSTFKVIGNVEVMDSQEGKLALNFKAYSDEILEIHSGYNYSEFSSKRTITHIEIIKLPFWHCDPVSKQMAFYFEKNKTTNPTVDFQQYLGKANSKKIITKERSGKETTTVYCPINSDNHLIIEGYFNWK